MLKSIINKVFSTTTKTNATKHRKTVNYEDAQTIGVIFSASDIQPKAINYFVKGLEKDGKKVKVLVYFNDKESTSFDFRYEYFTKKDFQKNGMPHSLQIDTFIEKEFDFLYCVNFSRNISFKYILKNSHAKCRVGRFHKNALDQFDLMVKISSDMDEVGLISQMLHFTKGMIVHNQTATSS